MEPLDPDLILKAYALGIFPMADSRNDPNIFWVEPKKRGVLKLDDFHLSRSLKKTIRQNPFDVRIDSDFTTCITQCAKVHQLRGERETWINQTIEHVFLKLHSLGHAHSVECWQGDKMVGGLYGLKLGGAFFGESMFHTKTDASKVAFTYLIARLKVGNFTLLDTQFLTSHLASFGVQEISQEAYLEMLHQALDQQQADFYRFPVKASPEDVLQAITQTS